MRLHRVLLLVATLPCSIPAQRASRVAEYLVTYTRGDAMRVVVHATIPSSGDRILMAASRPGDVPELALAGWPALIRQLQVTDADGRAVNLTGNGASGWKLGRSIEGPLNLDYEVDYSALAARGWPAPREAAFADSRHFVIVGRSLFITSPFQDSSTVRFVLADGWQPIVGWPSRPELPGTRSVASVADLTENLVVFTEDAPDAMSAGGFTLAVVPLGPWQSVRGEVHRVLGAILARLVEFIGFTGHADYVMVLLPQVERGGESFRSSFALTLDSIPSGANLADWGNLIAHEVFHYWNGWRLRGAAYASSQWFQEGFTEYAANHAIVSAGLVSPEEFYKKLADHFVNYRRLTTPLDAPGTHKGPPLYSGGALVAFSWDAMIRRETHCERGLGDVMRALMRKTDNGARAYGWPDIEAALTEIAPGNWPEFRRRYIQGMEPLPVSESLARIGLLLDDRAGAIHIGPDPAASTDARACRRALLGTNAP